MRRRLAVGVDEAVDQRPLEGDSDMVGGLEDLVRIFHVHDARHAGQEALRQRVGGLAVLVVGESFGLELWFVRNFRAIEYASTGRHPVACGMIAEVVGGAAVGEPDSLKIRAALCGARDLRGG